MRTPISLLLLLFLQLSFGQAGDYAREAETSYERGQCDAACRKCVQALRIKDNHRKAQEYLQLSWDCFLKKTMNDIRMNEMAAEDLKGNDQAQKRQAVVDGYKQLVEVRNECTSLPPITNKSTGKPFNFGENDFFADWQAAKNKLAEASAAAAQYHYDRGLAMEPNADMETAKLAAREFKLALKNSPGFKDAQARYDANRAKATKRLAIIPFENNSGQGQYGAVQDMITDRVIAEMMKDADAMEFTDLITRDELQMILNEQKLNMSALLDESSVVESGALLGVHQLVTGRINQIACDVMPVITRRFEQQATCVTGYTTAYNKDGKPYQKPVYGTLGAMVTEHKKEAKFRINGSYKILDVKSGQMLSGDSFTEEVPWQCTWGTFTGSECALDGGAQELVRSREKNPPTCGELVNQGSQKLAVRLGGRITNAIR